MLKIFRSLEKYDIQYISSLYYQNVRWATKPRWLPTAKTKVFRVPPRQTFPPEETAERKRLYRVFQTHRKAVKVFFNELHRSNETSQEILERLEQEKEDDWKKCMELNDKWNQQLAVERARRDAEELEKECEAVREAVRLKEQRERERLEQLEEIIRQEKEASKHFITENNIDEHIEKILNAPPHSFYYAIDREGQIYSGLSSTPDMGSESNSKIDEAEVTRDASSNS